MYHLSFYLLCSVLFVCACTDAAAGRIFNIVVIPAGLLLLISRLFASRCLQDVLECILSLCFPLLLLMPFWIASRYTGRYAVRNPVRNTGLDDRFRLCTGCLGGGDIKLLVVVSLGMAFHEFLVCIFISFSLAALCGIARYLKTRCLSARIPLAPFIFTGFLLSHLGGYFL